tara:strand:+ start:29 stop:640 length:612 start_codon:yes stop_codon:yes gene_type:complete
MNNLIQKKEKEQIEKLLSKKSIPAFRSGDTLKVTLKIVEGERSRSQAFEGVCIARKNSSINSKFTLRKSSHGEVVERVFPLFSPSIEKIEVIRKGDVKRAKLYYLRNRTGKRARIADLDRGDEVDQYAMTEESIVNDEKKDIEDKKITENKSDDNINEKKLDDQNKKTDNKEEESVASENNLNKEKSESAASEADKTKDETKS